MQGKIAILAGITVFASILLLTFWPIAVALSCLVIWLLLRNTTLAPADIIKNKWFLVALGLIAAAGLTIFVLKSIDFSSDDNRPKEIRTVSGYALIQNQPNGPLERFPIISGMRKDETRLLAVRIRMSKAMIVRLIGITDSEHWEGTWSDKPKTIRGEFSMTSSDGKHFVGTYDDDLYKKKELKIEIFFLP